MRNGRTSVQTRSKVRKGLGEQGGICGLRRSEPIHTHQNTEGNVIKMYAECELGQSSKENGRSEEEKGHDRMQMEDKPTHVKICVNFMRDPPDAGTNGSRILRRIENSKLSVSH